MINHALISIHPHHVQNIVDGIKTVELRRTNLHLKPGQQLWIYSTAPVSRIEVVVSVRSVHRLAPSSIWRKFGSQAAINREEFDLYVGERIKLTAIELGNVRKLRTPYVLSDLRYLQSDFHPPQLAIYLEDENSLLAALKKHHPRLSKSNSN